MAFIFTWSADANALHHFAIILWFQDILQYLRYVKNSFPLWVKRRRIMLILRPRGTEFAVKKLYILLYINILQDSSQLAKHFSTLQGLQISKLLPVRNSLKYFYQCSRLQFACHLTTTANSANLISTNSNYSMRAHLLSHQDNRSFDSPKQQGKYCKDFCPVHFYRPYRYFFFHCIHIRGFR